MRKAVGVLLAILLLCGSIVSIPVVQAFADVDFDPTQYSLEELNEIVRIINAYYPKTPEGEVLYDQDGLYIEYRGMYENSQDRWIINLYIYNGTGEDKTILLNDVRANKFIIRLGNKSNTIIDDSVFLSSANFSYIINLEDLKLYDIKSLNSIDFTLVVRNGGSVTGDTIAELPISIRMEMALPE